MHQAELANATRAGCALLAAAGIVFAGCSRGNAPAHIDAPTPGSPIAAQFSQIAEQAVADGLVTGAQYALVEDGRVLRTGAAGFADRETGRRMSADTPINIASISKAFTAWGVLALAERRQLDLDGPVDAYLTGFRLGPSQWPGEPVSMRMLLGHTAGLSTPSAPVIPATRPLPDLVAVLEGRSSVPRTIIEQRPGAGFRYSAGAYLLLQLLITEHSGRTFADYMAERVLQPAGMPGSTFALADDLRARAAVYYREDGRRRATYHLPGAAGGLYSTANDMARFILLYTAQGRATRAQILTESRYEEMLAAHVPVVLDGIETGAVHYAMGHMSYRTAEGARIVLHSGGNPGLRALFIVDVSADDGFFAVVNDDRGTLLIEHLLAAWGRHYGLTPEPLF